MDQSGIIGEVLEQGGQVIKATAKQVAGVPKSAAQTAVSQIAPGLSSDSEESSDNQKQAQKPQATQQAGSVSNSIKNQINPASQKSPEDQAKIEKIRQELHSNYYQNLINPPKAKEEPVAEKLEAEDKQEEQKKIFEEQKKQESDAAIRATQSRTTETLKGIGG